MSGPFGHMNPREAQQALDARDDLLLLDCREEFELELAAIPGALAIPMGEIPGRLDEIDREQEIVVVCHHGIRSQAVSRFLADAGFPRVTNLTGGIDAWALEVDPEVGRY